MNVILTVLKNIKNSLISTHFHGISYIAGRYIKSYYLLTIKSVYFGKLISD